MALSDHERRLLAEMEAALKQDDPRLVSTMTGKVRTRQGSRLLLGGLLLLGGMAILLVGLIAQTTPVGIVGFLIALAGVVLFFSNFGGAVGGRERGAPKPKKTPWSSKLEERWDRRNFDN
jgi:hypothetical protein